MFRRKPRELPTTLEISVRRATMEGAFFHGRLIQTLVSESSPECAVEVIRDAYSDPALEGAYLIGVATVQRGIGNE